MPETLPPVRTLPEETAQKIAAGEVIDRPAAVVRELLDNAIDAGARKISVETDKGGIDRIRVSDDGYGMTKEDLAVCRKNHSTSKITSAQDLLAVRTLGFRGEALASIHAVCRMEITSARGGSAYKSLPGGQIVPAVRAKGTLIQADGIFDTFPARKQFLKRPAAETALCRQAFLDKALPWPQIEFRLVTDGTLRFLLSPADSLKTRCLDALQPPESALFFHEITGSGGTFRFTLVLGGPEVVRRDRRSQFVFVNGRRIDEFALRQAVEFGAEGRFPNGLHPFFCLFLQVDPDTADFNIHPAKREVRFRDPGAIHHTVSSVCRDFYRHNVLFSHTQGSGTADPGVFAQTAHEAAGPAPEPRTLFPGGFPDAGPAQHTTGKMPVHFPDIQTAAENGPEYRSGFVRPETGPASGEPDFRYLGQILGTFLAVETGGSLLLIDQHAAHERIMYNEILSHRGEIQELLVPYRIDAPDDAADRSLRQKKRGLAEAGFILKDDGDGFWLVTAVPARWSGSEKELREELLSGAAEPENLVSRLYAAEACRRACKDGDILDPQTARKIAAQALTLPEPFCPHGRPVYTVITKEELFRRVKRT